MVRRLVPAAGALSELVTGMLPVAVRTDGRSPQAPATVLAAAAVDALIDEARLTPKPGLVDAAGSGAHDDMSLDLLIRSAEALRPAFCSVADAARSFPVGITLRERLGRIGRQGEALMRQATGGVNTHRGALWLTGLLVAGVAVAGDDLDGVVATARELASIPDRSAPVLSTSHGGRAREAYGAGGAVWQAQAGFPHVVGFALPTLRARLGAGGFRHAALDALLAVMASLDDTCVLHRGGLSALEVVRHGARGVLTAGGSSTVGGWHLLGAFDRALTDARLSPGGSADVLGAALFLHRTTSPRMDEWRH